MSYEERPDYDALARVRAKCSEKLYTREEIERLLAQEREKVREKCLEAVVSVEANYYARSIHQQSLWAVVNKCRNAIRQLDLTALDKKEKG